MKQQPISKLLSNSIISKYSRMSFTEMERVILYSCPGIRVKSRINKDSAKLDPPPPLISGNTFIHTHSRTEAKLGAILLVGGIAGHNMKALVCYLEYTKLFAVSFRRKQHMQII